MQRYDGGHVSQRIAAWGPNSPAYGTEILGWLAYALGWQCDKLARVCATFKLNKCAAGSRLEQGNGNDVAAMDLPPRYLPTNQWVQQLRMLRRQSYFSKCTRWLQRAPDLVR